MDQGMASSMGDIELGIGDMDEYSEVPILGVGMPLNLNPIMGPDMNIATNTVDTDGADINDNTNNKRKQDADSRAAARRRRDVRTARDKLGEQFEELKEALPRRETGTELTAKSQILEHTLIVLRQLMTRATTLAVELAVVSPEATHRWVQDVSDDGRRPIQHTVAAVMKLFCWSRKWHYAEWWTLDENSAPDDIDIDIGGPQICHVHSGAGKGDDSAAERCNLHGDHTNRNNNRDVGDAAADATDGNSASSGDTTTATCEDTQKPTEMAERDAARPNRGAANNVNIDVGPPSDNAQACVIRDCVSVMKLTRTLINVKSCEGNVSAFARISKSFQFRPRIGMPGRVWSSRRAMWLPTLGDADSYIRSSLALKFGMKTCLAVPIVVGGQVHSVMAFYSQVPISFNNKCHDLATTLSESLANIYSPHPSSGWDMSFGIM